jgi:RNA polymerase sigma-70 factor (ECF subfamily)
VQNDRRLAKRMAAGERRAFKEFTDAFGPRIHRLASRYTNSASDCEDLTQEIFIDIYRAIGGFKGSASLATWAYRVAMNHCLKHRERSPKPTVEYSETMQTAHDPSASPEKHAEQGELKDKIQAALDTLTPEHRDVVILHELHGLTYIECADVLQIPIGTVKSRLSNAFRRLRDCLCGYVFGDQPDSIPNTLTEIS